jgi:hypothetical protein
MDTCLEDFNFDLLLCCSMLQPQYPNPQAFVRLVAAVICQNDSDANGSTRNPHFSLLRRAFLTTTIEPSQFGISGEMSLKSSVRRPIIKCKAVRSRRLLILA